MGLILIEFLDHLCVFCLYQLAIDFLVSIVGVDGRVDRFLDRIEHKQGDNDTNVSETIV